MIRVQIVLRCDGCKLAYPHLAEGFNTERHERSIGDLRDAAIKKGWSRYRATPAGPIGDYCPDCVQAHEAKKASPKRATRRKASP